MREPSTPSPSNTSTARRKRPTMGDVAARVGVSRQLVSLVVRGAPGPSPETRERILRAADELGYRPDTAAQLLRRARSGQVGVLFTLAHPHDVALVEAIYPAAKRRGYDIALGATGPARDEHQAVEDLLAYRVEALIVIGPYASPQGLRTLAEQIPVVEISRRVDVAGVDSVRTADDRGVRLAVDHLVDLGHRAIVHVDGGRMPGATDRRRGYRSAMRRHHLDDEIRVIPGDYTEESGARVARDLLCDDRLPTAIVAGNDRCAVGALDELRRSAVGVPDEVSIVGYDNSRIARLAHVDLTSVRQNTEELARHAIRLAVDRLDGTAPERPRVVQVPPDLVVRGSTGPAR